MTQFINYELAKSMQEIGFKEDCLATIDETEYLKIEGSKNYSRGSMFCDVIPCPTWEQCFDFFRDNYKRTSHVDIHNITDLGNISYYYQIRNFKDKFEQKSYISVAGYHTLLEAKRECLKELINYVI